MATSVSVRAVGKKYALRHETRPRYGTLREALAGKFSGAARRLAGRGGAPRVTTEEFWALEDVTFDVAAGERVGIIGRNGAGKSTLLKILCRITEPTTGSAHLRGNVSGLLEVGTGFHPELSGRENIFLNGVILGMTRAEVAAKLDEIVDFAEIEKFLDTPVKYYSSGMYVRLAFAVSAHLEPDVLIVDEVLAVGDAQFQKKCLGKMDDVGRQGRTVLFVSHAMSTVARLCPRCILLEKGKVVADGTADEVIRRYLSGVSLQAGEYRQAHDPEKEMNLRRVALVPGRSGVPDHVRYDEPVRIAVEYEVNRPAYNSTIWVALQTLDGVMVLCTTDHDMQPAMLGHRAPGYYRAELAIPEKWLNVGEYNVVIGVIQNHPVVVHDRVETINFTIAEVGTPGSLTQEGVRRGVLQPFLPWKSEKVADPS